MEKINIKENALNHSKTISNDDLEKFIEEYNKSLTQEEKKHLLPLLKDESIKKKLLIAQLETGIISSLIYQSLKDSNININEYINDYLDLTKEERVEITILRIYYLDLIHKLLKLKDVEEEKYDIIKNDILNKLKNN